MEKDTFIVLGTSHGIQPRKLYHTHLRCLEHEERTDWLYSKPYFADDGQHEYLVNVCEGVNEKECREYDGAQHNGVRTSAMPCHATLLHY